MALTVSDPYVEFAEYAERSQVHTTDDQPTIEAVLISVSRWLDRMLGDDATHGRVFYQTTEQRIYDGNGSDTLEVDDFTAVTAIGLDSERDGTYDGETLDATAAYVQFVPYNLDVTVQPYTHIRLLPTTTAPRTIWTPQRANVRISATWGYPLVPEPIKEAVVLLTRQLRDLELAGFTLTLQNLDAGIQMAPGASSIVKGLKAAYSRRMPTIA